MEHKLPDSRVKSMTKIRTRYAPSPTGKMHVGNLRTALYAYLIAKHEGGDFMLRMRIPIRSVSLRARLISFTVH